MGQSILAAAMDAPVAVMETAGEGGPWGMAVLAAYMVNKADGEPLENIFQTGYLMAKRHSNAAGP